jgi:putative transposase
MLIAHRIRLDPNKLQCTYLARAAGTARFAYNWALAEWGRQYAIWKLDRAAPRPGEAALRRQLNRIKREQFPWMLDVTKCAPQMAIIQLGRAFENFFAGRARYPTFRRKCIDDRFTLTNDQVHIDGRHIRIPKLGWVRMCEALRFTGHIVSATISRTANHWYASITVDNLGPPLPSADNQSTVGIDLGISRLATLSTGEIVEGPKAFRRLMGNVRRLSRRLARKVIGSANRIKAKLKLAQLHERISNIRRDSLHKLTTSLAQRFHAIGIEDLNVKGMLKTRKLARSIADMGFYEFRRQLEYKLARYGGKMVVASRWYPSSKTCSHCGFVIDMLTLAQRNWVCPSCGTVHDRDVNAAINLKRIAESSSATACGGEGAGLACKRQVKPAPMKQESNCKVNYD